MEDYKNNRRKRMPQNAYEAPNATPSALERRPSLTALEVTAIIGSIVQMLLGIAILGLGTVAADGRSFFLIFGVHQLACGFLEMLCVLIKKRGGFRLALRWTSMIVNAVLVGWIVILISNGTVRGPLSVAAPLLFGVPAVLNVVSAQFNHGERATNISPND